MFAYSIIDSTTSPTNIFRYTQEEIDVYDRIMKLVPGFQDTIIKFQTVPNQLLAFINLVCSRIYALQSCF